MTAPMTTGSVLCDAIIDSDRAPLRLLEAGEPNEVAVQRMWTKIHARHVADPHAWKDGVAPWSPLSGWGQTEDRSALERWLRKIRRMIAASRGQRFALGALAVVMLSLVVLRWRVPSPLKLADPHSLANDGVISAGESVSTTDKSRSIAFAEGSSIELSPQSELSVLSNEGPTIVLSLRSGRAHFSVTPGGPRQWTVDAGQLSVRVIGTVFVVDKRDGKTSVEVEKGIVAVTGAVPGGFVELRAGQRVESLASRPRTDPTATSSAIVPSRPRASPEDIAGKGDTLQKATPTDEPREDSSAELSDSLPDSEQEEVIFTLDDLEPCEECDDSEQDQSSSPGQQRRPGLRLVGLSVDELMSRADEERRAGRPGRAATYLEHVVRIASPGDPRRALAALSYARISWNPAKVAQVLVDTLDSMPAGLREPALARLVEAMGQSGQSSRARSYAEIYLQEFPSGLHASKVKGWVP